MTLNGVPKLGSVILVSALMMIFSTSGFAQQIQDGQQRQGRNGDQPAPGDFMERFDANKDGKVAKDEFPMPDRFEGLDKNGDGFITEDEVPIRPPGGGQGRPQMQSGQQGEGRIGDLPGAGEFMDALDKNEDGKVTQDEFPMSADMFNILDKNGDGAITEDEAF